MLWFYLALAATFMWAAVNVIDKYVISGFFKKPNIQLFISGVVQAVIAVAVVAFLGLSIPINAFPLLGIAVGIISFAATVLYFKALFEEEVSRAIPVLSTIPLWVTLFAGLFLGEFLTPAQYLGIVFLSLGSILVSLKKQANWKLGFGFLLMLTSSVLYAVEHVTTKFLTLHLDFWNVYFWETMGFLVCSLALFALRGKDIKEAIGRFRKGALLSASSEAISSIAWFMMLFSFSIGFVSLSIAVTSLQPLVVLIFAILLSVFWPRIIKEELERATIALKALAILLVIAGSILLL